MYVKKEYVAPFDSNVLNQIFVMMPLFLEKALSTRFNEKNYLYFIINMEMINMMTMKILILAMVRILQQLLSLWIKKLLFLKIGLTMDNKTVIK